jgi:hypothetical protein
VAAGILRVGDALVHTNPTLGQGTALALRAAVWVARQLADAEDPYEFAHRYHHWALQELRPWYETQVSADRATAIRLQQGSEELDLPACDERAAIDALAREDPDIMRVRARVRHLMEHPDAAYTEPGIRTKLTRWLSTHHRLEDIFDGPTRTDWRAIVGSAQTVPLRCSDPPHRPQAG